MRKLPAALIIPLCFVLMSGCGKQSPADESPGLPVPSPTEITVSEEPRLIVYEDGLISLRIEKDSVELSFNHDLWDDKYGIYGSNPEFLDYMDQLKAGPFLITGLEGTVKDACIVQTENLSGRTIFGNMVIPTVIMLMEDGNLQMTLADPNTYDMGDNITYDSWRLPWIKDIVSIDVLPESENNPGAIIAEDSRGQRFDLCIPISFYNLFNRTLYCLQPNTSEWEDEGDYMTLTLFEDGKVEFQRYFDHGELYEDYEGTYEVILAENPGIEALATGTISFDLDLSWWIWEGGDGSEEEADEISLDAKDVFEASGWKLSGVYPLWAGYNDLPECFSLLVWPNPKLDTNINPEDSIAFYTYKLWKELAYSGDGYLYGYHDDDSRELAYRLLDNVAYVRVMVEEHGKYIWADGEITEFTDGEVGRNVLLIEHVPGEFGGYNVEAKFTILEDGSIYEYNYEDDLWYLTD